METETKTESEVIDTKSDTVESDEGTDEKVSIFKKEYDTLNQTLGSLKREIKDLRKAKDDSGETTKKSSKSDDNPLIEKLEKVSLRQAGITHQDDIELARNTAKKWGIDIDEVVNDEDFKVKLERQQTNRDNALATSKIKGGSGSSQAKFTPEYWIAKGMPPTPTDVPDRKTRAKITRAMMTNKDSGSKFYNE